MATAAVLRSRPPAAADARWAKAWRGGRFYLGLLGLFFVYTTMWLALSVAAAAVVPGWRAVVITSDSMAPSIQTGDVVVVGPHDGRRLAPGTVAVFADPAGSDFITHRIVGVEPDGTYRTRGDANVGVDSTALRPEQTVGVGRFLIPLIGLPLTWFWAGAWVKLAVWALAMLLALWVARYALLPKYDPWGAGSGALRRGGALDLIERHATFQTLQLHKRFSPGTAWL